MTRQKARQIIAIWLVSSKGAKGQCGYIEGWFDEEDAEAFRMAIEELSADAVQKWVPVSEGLPKEEKTVLTCDARGGIVFGRYSKGKWYWEAEACADYWARDDSVIAWMPRPEPYKGGDAE